MRVAASRVAAVDAVSSTREHASRCVAALPVSPSLMLRAGAVAGAAATALGVFSALKRKRKAAEKQASRFDASAPYMWQLVMQVLAPALIPAAQRALQKWSQKGNAESNGAEFKF